MGGGHYTAYTQHRNGGWYECDDSRVTPFHSTPVTSSGYVLFYKRKDIDFSPFSVPEPTQQDEESSSESGSEDSEGPTFTEKEDDYYTRIRNNQYLPFSDSDDSL